MAAAGYAGGLDYCILFEVRTVKAAFAALGCKVNQYEADAYAAIFREKGAEIGSFDQVCDVYVVNTCSVTNLGDRKSRQMLRRAKRLNPGAIVVATGCYAQTAFAEVSAMDEVDLVIGTASRHRIYELAEAAMRGEKPDTRVDIMKEREFEELETRGSAERSRAYIKIEDGCDNFCSYCIIPYARGPVRSRKLENILAEARRLAGLGYREAVLTGIHVASYGKDMDCGHGLTDVIEAVAGVEGIERIRISSIDPRAFTEDFVARAAACEKLCRHFHISLQSGSASVLKRMNRKYTPEQYLDILTRIRAAMPDCSVTTDIICGFPEETEEEFAETLDFVRKAAFARIHVFPYSERRGTAAARMPQIPHPVREKRAAVLAKVGEELRESFERGFIGKTVTVLFEQTKNGVAEGLSKNYIRVCVPSDADLTDSIAPVKITAFESGRVWGELN